MTKDEAARRFESAINTLEYTHLGSDAERAKRAGYDLAQAAVEEALANASAEQLTRIAEETGTLFGVPIADYRSILHTAEEQGIPVVELGQRTKALTENAETLRGNWQAVLKRERKWLFRIRELEAALREVIRELLPLWRQFVTDANAAGESAPAGIALVFEHAAAALNPKEDAE